MKGSVKSRSRRMGIAVYLGGESALKAGARGPGLLDRQRARNDDEARAREEPQEGELSNLNGGRHDSAFETLPVRGRAGKIVQADSDEVRFRINGELLRLNLRTAFKCYF